MKGGGLRPPTASRRQWWVCLAAAAGVAVLVWTIGSVGPDTLLRQARGLGGVLPLVLVLAGARFAMQAAGWRLAMDERQRPGGAEAFAAVVAGEAAGYFAWGPASKEPVKALLVGHRLPERTALAAAVVERFAYSAVATMLMIAAAIILAVRTGHVTWLAAGAAAAVAALVVATRVRKGGATPGGDRRSPSDVPSPSSGSSVSLREALASAGRNLRERRGALAGIVLLAAAQEIINVVEAYVVLAWLGSSATLTGVVMFEGMNRLLNAAGSFIPGKVGVSEGASTALAAGFHLGSAHGLGLALARRIRSLLWGAIGVALLALRATAGAPAAGQPAGASPDWA